MNVRIKRIDPTLPLPEYQTSGACAFDLYARETTTISAKSIGLIPTNIIVETPPGYMLTLAPRSSTPKKKGLLIPHGIGIVDQDYCGPADEILMQLYNFTEASVTIERGERVGQAVFVAIEKPAFIEETIDAPSRGGFGSSNRQTDKNDQ